MEVGMAAAAAGNSIGSRAVCSLTASSPITKQSIVAYCRIGNGFGEGSRDRQQKNGDRGVADSRQPISVTRGVSDDEERPVQSGLNQDIRRREVLGKSISLLMCTFSIPVLAAEEEFTVYEDTTNKYSLLVPQEWTKGEGKVTGQRKVTAFYPENDSSANVNIVITDLGADFTALGSIGSIDIFAENLVNSLDRAWQRPPGQAAKLVDSRSKNGMYYVEYTVQKPGEEKRHLISVVGMASNGWINRLYTVTGQFWEEDGAKYKANVEKAVSSFRFI